VLPPSYCLPVSRTPAGCLMCVQIYAPARRLLMCSRVGDGEQFHVRGAEQTKIDRDVGLRRNERRRMRAKLKVFTPPSVPAPSPATPPHFGLSRCPPDASALSLQQLSHGAVHASARLEVGSRWQHVWVKMNAMKIDH